MSSLRIVSRAEHPISRSQIAPGALKTLYTLKDAGFEAYIVGGGVRDLLLGVQPKDFDIATSAHPEQVKRLFRNCRLIGRRFRLAHVFYGQETVEVATFRASHSDEDDEAKGHSDESGRILRDNVYGTLEDDAFRRDFTINALFYGIEDFAIRDYVGGMEDIAARRLRMIGDPEKRYREDPVRMLRAVRLATKLGLTIDPATAAPIPELAPLLANVPSARLFDEVLKLLLHPAAVTTFDQLQSLGLLSQLFPGISRADAADLQLMRNALGNTATRLAEGRSVSPAFLFAALLWPGARETLAALDNQPIPPDSFWPMIGQQVARVSVPKRFTVPMREMWELQPRFLQRAGKRPQRFLSHPRFRAAYDFLLLRAEVGQADAELAQWWTQLQAGSLVAPVTMPEEGEDSAGTPARKPRRRRRRGPRKPATPA